MKYDLVESIKSLSYDLWTLQGEGENLRKQQRIEAKNNP